MEKIDISKLVQPEAAAQVAAESSVDEAQKQKNRERLIRSVLRLHNSYKNGKLVNNPILTAFLFASLENLDLLHDLGGVDYILINTLLDMSGLYEKLNSREDAASVINIITNAETDEEGMSAITRYFEKQAKKGGA